MCNIKKSSSFVCVCMCMGDEDAVIVFVTAVFFYFCPSPRPSPTLGTPLQSSRNKKIRYKRTTTHWDMCSGKDHTHAQQVTHHRYKKKKKNLFVP